MADKCRLVCYTTDVKIDAPYDIPEGACCEGSYCSITTAANCNGVYQGDDTDCDPNPCEQPTPTGACCNGAVCTITTQAGCGGSYQGDDTDCDPNPCIGTTGACCTNGNCTITTQAACQGEYYGDSSTCSGRVCPKPVRHAATIF